ncbi:MAG: hypothetical protein IKP22_13680 [Clostridia bacterium]|nr:hypothetical protein [Clostridia bacterium]
MDAMEKNGRGDAEFSILDPHGRHREKKELPAYFRDLNLETVLDEMAFNWGSAVRELFHYLPETAEDEKYRRAVYGDVKKEGVFRALEAFVRRTDEAEDLRREKEKVPGTLQHSVWQVREAEVRCAAMMELKEALDREELSSQGLLTFRDILRQKLFSAGESAVRERVNGIMKRIRAFRMVITCEKDRIRVEPGTAAGEYGTLRGEGSGIIKNPFAATPLLTDLEAVCLQVLTKKDPGFFREIREVSDMVGDRRDPLADRFRKEIVFYLSFDTFRREMEEGGFSFAAPSVTESCPFMARGLYDLALACVFRREGKKVVANDFACREGERFFVLTGPNQGGKTTFARSLGQLVYFARIGLDVPAAEANVPFFRDIQSHFSVEESVETGRGKLKEELVRLAPMMEEKRQGTFVVINELFTTAAGYDALIMGRRVLEHFIRLGCMGIFVTHLKELASAHEGAVSLRASLDENRVPTYVIRRGEAEDVPCAETRVKEHRLTYEQLKERLS